MYVGVHQARRGQAETLSSLVVEADRHLLRFKVDLAPGREVYAPRAEHEARVERHDTILFTLAACVIIGREIVISALREWMAELGERTSVAVSYVGKVKTAFQMIAISGLLAIDPRTDENWLLALSYLMLYAAAVLTLYSMFVYLKAAWVVMKERDKSL